MHSVPDEKRLRIRFSEFTDEILILKCNSGNLTALAYKIASEEVQSRNLILSSKENSTDLENHTEYFSPQIKTIQDLGDLKILASYQDPINARIVNCLLESEGIYSFIANEHQIYANWQMSLALGYVQIMVPESQITNAQSILKDLDEGFYSLDDLIESEEDSSTQCPRCRKSNVIANDISWKISFFFFFFLHIPIPFDKNIKKCTNCKLSWKVAYS